MFKENKYTNWYFSIVETAQLKNRKKKSRKDPEYEYFENHHILPRSLGGSNEGKNLVLLTAKEHFVCHMLLCKMVTENTDEYYKMTYAIHALLSADRDGNLKSKLSFREIIALREYFYFQKSVRSKGKNNPFFGKKHSKETKEKISKANAARSVSEDTKNKMSKSHLGQKSWNKGRTGVYTEQANEKRRISCSMSNRGKKRTDAVKKAIQIRMVGNSNRAKKWYVENDSGERVEIENMKKYCETNGISYSMAHRAYTLNQPYKGLLFQSGVDNAD
jgi:hypothetical protein